MLKLSVTLRRLLIIAIGLWIAAAFQGVCQTAADDRKMADRAVAIGQYDRAAALYRQEAQIYDRRGDHNGADGRAI